MLDERMLVAWIGDAEREKNGEKCELLTAGSDKGPCGRAFACVRGLRRADKSFRLCPTTHRRALVGSRRSRGV